MWKEIEQIFNRAFFFSFSRRKFFFVFPLLVLCGISVAFCHTLAIGVHSWVGNSLAFFPTFLSYTILMGMGVVLIRIYHDEIKARPLPYNRVIWQSRHLVRKIISCTLPFLVVYFILWSVLGVFYLFRSIPHVGPILGIVLSFGPFLLLLGFLMIALFSLWALFFITPMIALKSNMNLEEVGNRLLRLKESVFVPSLFLFIGLVPLVCLIGLLILSAALTGMTYVTTERTWGIFFEWFFIMLPFAAFLTPGVVFFFNFAAESFVWLEKHSSLYKGKEQ